MKLLKKPMSILLSLLMIVSLFTIVPFEAEAAQSVTIYSHHWDTVNKKVINDPFEITNYTELLNRTSDELESGYYTVKNNTTVKERLHVANGRTVGIYLGNNATLTSYGGIRVDKGATLNIYAATNTNSKLIVDTNKGSKDYLYCAAIGSDDRQNAGTINIHGGKIDITADHGAYGACIGGGNQAAPECVTIWDGDIFCHRDETTEASYYFRAAAIGGGYNAPVSCNKSGEGVRIFGGKVYAKGNGGAGIGTGGRGRSDYVFNSDAAIAIYGGDVTAYSRTGAGIGGGNDLGYNGPINIYGGTVNAMSVGEPDYDSGAGIGGGMLGNQRGAITISGGTVFATGAEGAGIGGGDEGNATVINITGGNVVANATMGGAGIGGGCEGDNGTVNISGSNTKVKATSETYKDGQAWSDAMNAGINNTNFYSDAHKYYATAMLFIKGLVELFGGEDSGCGIGGGYKGRAGTITIDGSTVNAESGSYSAAIGSGDDGKGGGKIIIKNGANVTANSGTDAAAIGSGNEVDETCDITITDSTVVAHGGEYAAGIGGGDEVDSGTIIIKNSTVTADTKTDGSGIGSGESGDAGNITIDNSTVTATGGAYGAGIGGGDDGDCEGTITIKNHSVVKAYGGVDGAGIGGGEDGKGGKIVIDNSDVTAQGKEYGAGIGGGENKGLSSIEIHGDSRVEAIAGSDGNSVAIGHGDYNTFGAGLTGDYPSNGSIYFSNNYIVSAGSDKDNTSEYNRFSSPSSYNACCNNKYALIHSCDHKNAVWCAETEWYHVKYCKDCGASFDYSEHHWGSDNKCIECGASAEMVTITFVERNNSGEVTRTIEKPRFSRFVMPEPENIPDGYTMYYWTNGSSSFIKPGEERNVSEETYTAVYFEDVETNYIDKEGIQQTVIARRLPKTDCNLQSGWYVIDYDSIAGDTESIRYLILGDVNLILADGVTWSNTNANFMNFGSREYNFAIYGQKEQTGTIDLLNVERPNTLGEFYNFTQYGGVIKAARVWAKNNINFVGGNFETEHLRANRVELGWTRWNDTFRSGDFSRYSDSNRPEVIITEGKPLQIQDNDRKVFNPGQLNEAQIAEASGSTLVPATNLKYSNNPQWTWSDDGTKAEAFFRCLSDSAYNVTLNADVTYTDEGEYRCSTATVRFKKVTYTDDHTVRIRWKISKGSCIHGDMEFSENPAAPGTKIHVNVIPNEGYAVKSITAVPSDSSLEVNVDGDSFKMPACNVTVNVDFATLIPASEPFINSDGEYILGTVEHYETNGKYYAVNDDGSLGAELTEEEMYVSYFDFELINDDAEYQINYYTGPTDTLTELVIPKTFNGKKVTVLGNDDSKPIIDYTDKLKTQFELKLNENISEIKGYAFYTMWVTKVKGDTSGLNKIGSYAFSWANSPGGYTLDIKLDYDGIIIAGSEIFNHMDITARLKHSTKLSRTTFSQRSIEYVFTDSHIIDKPEWTWEPDYSSAKAKFTCDDERCRHEETVDATVSVNDSREKTVYTAIAEFEGNTYTDEQVKNKVSSEVRVVYDQHGSVESDKSTAYEGETVTITIRPDTGYKLKTFKVTAGGENGTPVEVTDNKFIMPAKLAYVYVEFDAMEYNINYESTAGGWVSGVCSANYLDDITPAVTPATGYELDCLKVTRSNGDDVTVYENTSFTMPLSDVTVKAIFKKKDLHITYDITGNGTVSGAETGKFNEEVPLTITPAEGYALFNIYAEDDEGGVSANILDGNLIMPDTAVTVYAEFIPIVPAKEPYIDENGVYHLGNVEYCEYDGFYYAVENGVTGNKSLDNVDVSYFDFEDMGTSYQITHYTGPTDNLTELVIPKTFKGKPVTSLGSGNDYDVFVVGDGSKPQFDLILNENIIEIKPYSFYTMWVKKVQGDTSNLSKIGKYAFSWANSPGGYTLDITLDYPGKITTGAGMFNHMNVTARLKHITTFSGSNLWEKKINYIFTDAHLHDDAQWEWADNYRSANAVFTCTDSRCDYEEKTAANVTSKYVEGAPEFTAKATFNGTEYTDVVALPNPLDNGYIPEINAATALSEDGNRFDLPGELVYTEGRLLGVQKKELIKTDTEGTGLRFIAELSSRLLDADDYGFEVAKNSKNSTGAFNDAGGFDIMQTLIDRNDDNIKSISCKGTTNNITGDKSYGDNDSLSTSYKYVTLAITDIPDDQGIAVRFYVEIDGIRYYARYTDAGKNNYRGCCTSYGKLAAFSGN